MWRICLGLLFVLAVSPAHAWNGQVVATTDGDSLKIQASSGEIVKIRLYGIDCPELGQPLGIEAQQAVQKISLHQIVTVDAHYIDRYGRTVATVYLSDGVSLQESLLLSGLAWIDPRYCISANCSEWEKYERQARAGCLGLWSHLDAMPPWEWRKKKR
ncbi:thermonuclease family protein [Desulfovibrio sp. OttesenSCG-928-I05]|nr:thermonuclease family protein [Desulfovibrio sp. OttesenSCG-928-I05]